MIGPLAWPDAVLCVGLLIGMPVLAVAQLPLVRAEELDRVQAYLASAVTIGILAGICLLVGTRAEGVRALGLVAVPTTVLVRWSLVLAGGGLAVLAGFRLVAGTAGWSESAFLRALLPRTRRERVTFVLLSLVAGLGEELAYRGYAIPVLAPALGPVGAAALTSVSFGVMHAYQGVLGVVRTTVLGGFLAWGLLAAGSLWPPIAAHAVVDVLAGTVLAERLTAG